MNPSLHLPPSRLRLLALSALGGLLLLPAASFGSTILVSQDFNDGTRPNIFSSSTNTTVAVQNNVLVQSGGGRGLLQHFAATTLSATGDTITLAHKFTISGPLTTNLSSSAELRFGLFNSNGGLKISDDNWNAADSGVYKGYMVTPTELGTTVGGKGQWTVRSRTSTATTALINSNTPYTPVGSAYVSTASWTAEVPYAVTFTLTKTSSGVDITTTVTGGDFGASGVTFTRTDTGDTNPAVYTFDTLCIYTSSTAGTGFKIDDLSVVYTPNVSVAAPTIVTPPTNQAVPAGGEVTFSVAATGEPLTYQWHRDGVDLGGATNAAYTIANAQAGDAASYSVTVTNDIGSATSAAGTLIVVPTPAGAAIFSETFANAARPGWYTSSSTSTLSVSNGTLLQATGGSGRGVLGYFNPQALGLGETLTATFSFELHGTAGSNFAAAQWRFGLFNSNGATKVDGDNFASTSYHTGAVYDFATQPGYAAFLGQTSWTVDNRNLASPQILSLNAAYTAVGDPETPAFTFEVNTNYVVTLSVQRTAAGSDVTVTVAGGAFDSGASFTRSDASADAVSGFDTFAVHCLSNFSDSFSIDDVQILRSSVTAPAIATPPASQTIAVGGGATLSVVATGTAPLTYQWQKDAVDLPGATLAALTLTNLQIADSGSYTATVTNTAGSATSAAAVLSVLNPPAIATPPATQTVNAGASATFTVVASGSAPFTYQWSKDGATVAGATLDSLTLAAVAAGDAGSYTVVVTNGVGSATSAAASLTVIAPPVIATPPASASVVAGANVTLTVVATGTAPLAYRWQKNGADVVGATAASLALTGVQVADSGAYTATVTNAAGSATSAAAVLTVTASAVPPTVDAPPANQNALVGQPVTLSVTASGSAPFSYQWYKDGAAIVGATSASYVIASASAADAGVYTVDVTNAGGTVTSSAATLAVASTYLSNVSVRAAMTEGQTLIVGFVVAGGPKPILVRAAGPALATFDLTGVADPQVVLFDSTNTSVGQNNDWDAALAPTFSALGAFAFEVGSKDAALLQSVDRPHTAQVTGLGNGTILVEAYDNAAGSNDGRKLTNLSARYRVGTGNDILIAGFVIGGTGTKQVLVRAIGPKLADFGVTGVLADPQLAIYDGGTVVASNDNWDASLGATFTALGAFALNSGSKDAAILVTLDAGKPYTVQVSGVGATTGESLVEIYDAAP